MTLPIESPDFWKERLDRARANGSLHHAIYETDRKRWESIGETHRKLLAGLLRSGETLLDAGCGYGALATLLPLDFDTEKNYTGVDLSPDLVEIAQGLWRGTFQVANLRKLPFRDKEFDVAVARSVEGMVKENLGLSAWREMEAELLRVAGRLILLNYSEPEYYRLVESVPDPSIHSHNSIWSGESYLRYRSGFGEVCEVYDLFVGEESRRMGIGSALLQRLGEKVEGTIYAFTRSSNGVARAFYEKNGFKEIQVEKFYGDEDGILVVLGAK